MKFKGSIVDLLPFTKGHAFANNPALKDRIFTASGLTGAQMEEIGKQRVLQWLDYRSRLVLELRVLYR